MLRLETGGAFLRRYLQQTDQGSKSARMTVLGTLFNVLMHVKVKDALSILKRSLVMQN